VVKNLSLKVPNPLPTIFLLLTLSSFFSGAAWCVEPDTHSQSFRVCADPNNLPFSNSRQEGFENKIAELLAGELRRELHYVWWPQRRGFLRSTLDAGACDVVMGIPAGFDPVLTTQPYYRSSYVFVYPKRAAFQVSSFNDIVLRTLKIGVHLIGDDYANSPPAHLLSQKGIIDNVVGYSIYGDYAEESPPAKIITAVAAHDIDMAIVWGPIAGYFARRQSEPLQLVPVPADASTPTLPLTYSIALGVRKKDAEGKARLDEVLRQKAVEVRKILEEYGVPLVQD
jgi:quinoprotein dehydrogenase-associated probable ABC transporter substrate-binding protein